MFQYGRQTERHAEECAARLRVCLQNKFTVQSVVKLGTCTSVVDSTQ